MLKRLAHNGKLWFGHGADPSQLTIVIVGVLGLGFLLAEGAVLSAQGVQDVAAVLIAVFVASTVSSIAGFAFSALCGALLFHVMDSPVYAVHGMIGCSSAIQLLSVAALWRSIDWPSPSVLL